jgi:hypothetical protein
MAPVAIAIATSQEATMSDYHYGSSRYRDADNRSKLSDHSDDATAWLLMALAAMAILATAWFGFLPPQNNQETAATRIHVTDAAPRP